MNDFGCFFFNLMMYHTLNEFLSLSELCHGLDDVFLIFMNLLSLEARLLIIYSELINYFVILVRIN